MKASTFVYKGKIFHFAYAQWAGRYLKSWALLESSDLKVDASTKYFKSKNALIQFIQNNF